MKGSLVWLLPLRTRRHWTDHLLLHIHATSTMMPRAPTTVAPSLVLKQNWETLAWLASWRSKLPDVDACPHTVFIHTSVLRHKPTNLIPLGFEAQTKKPSWWFCWPNHQTATVSFVAQTGKPERVVLMPNHKNHSDQFWGQTGRNPSEWFWGQNTRTVATGFEAKPGGTIDLGFEAEPRNTRSLFSCTRWRLHTTSPDLSIV
jgi:hypothetical protein